MSAPCGLPYWLDIERPTFPQLDGDIHVDAVIIGAGISGLKLAYFLNGFGVSTAILEGGRVGDGASGRNQGSICQGAGMFYRECIEFLETTAGHEARARAAELWRLGKESHRLARQQIEEFAIECDYQREGFALLARRDIANWEQALAAYRDDAAILRGDGFDVDFLDDYEAERRAGRLFAGGICYNDDAQFHSGKYVTGLALGVSLLSRVKLFENTRVTKVERDGDGVKVNTAHGTVSAGNCFLALNALAPQLAPHLERGLRAERGQAFVTAPLDVRPCTGSYGTAMAWWREIPLPDGRFRLLFGGGRGQDEPDSLFRQFDAEGRPHPKLEGEGSSPSEAHQQRLDHQFALVFPNLAGVEITHRWGGLQCFTADHLPMIGEFDSERRIHGMAGFSGRGNTYADAGALLLAGRVAGVRTTLDDEYGKLVDTLMKVNRSSAQWPEWHTNND